MAIAPTYPGVYIEEIPSGVRTITGVATSIAAFIDYFKYGLMNKPVQIFSMADFNREFGGLDSRSEASYAIQQFFLNGGTEAWVVRTASGEFAAATCTITDKEGLDSLKLEAGRFDPDTHPETCNPGTWGDNLRVRIEYPTPTSNDHFNLTISLVENQNGQEVPVCSEVFRGLSMKSEDARYVRSVINDEFTGSKLIRITLVGSSRPKQNGTVSGELTSFNGLSAEHPQVNVSIGADGSGIAKLTGNPTTLSAARTMLESAIRAARPELKAFAQATVTIVDNCLRILAGPTESDATITFSAVGTDLTASNLGLISGEHLDGVISGDVSGALSGGISGQLKVTIGDSTADLALESSATLGEARSNLEKIIREAADNQAFSLARVVAYVAGPVQRLIVLAGVADAAVTFADVEGGTTASDLGLVSAAEPVTSLISSNLDPIPTVNEKSTVIITIGANEPVKATIAVTTDGTLADIASKLQDAVHAASSSSAYTDARVAAYTQDSENRLVVMAGTLVKVMFSAAADDAQTVQELGLDAASEVQNNEQQYTLTGSADGEPPAADALIGDLGAKTGIYALEDVDLFNILCIPRTATFDGDDKPKAAAVITVANSYCEKRRAFFIMDTPTGFNEVQGIKDWLETNANLRHKNTALYFPRLEIPDPMNDYRPRSVGASGTMAGLYARTDSSRGVWKAPAGTEATLVNVQKLEYVLSDSENGTLNPLAINCLRNFPVYGSVAWGGRTLKGSDQEASEWKYIPVRRLALYLEESLFRGTQWVVFEPNDEPLWAQIRLNIGAFMHNLFSQGAFQGQTPKEAYFVKCDKETTTQNDINLGIVNIIVGFAPLKPAEFVIIKIQQMAGQISS